MSTNRIALLPIVILVVLLVVPCLGADRPVIPAVQVSEPPKIDGDLSDKCWESAPKVADFVVMNDGSKPCEPTTAWICYDQKNIYVAYHCMDCKPEKIVAQQRKRGGDLWNDDLIEVDIDLFNNQQQVIWVDINPLGTQYERLQSGDVSKIEWRGDWMSAAKRVPDGYTIEFALPFSILQYDPKKTSMGITFTRRHARTGNWWSAPNIGSNWDARKYYVWDGLKLPSYKKKPLLLGYSLLGRGDGSSLNQMGLDVKHAFTTTMTGVLSVKPDFQSVEQQVAGIDFSYNERYLNDARPYFQEGKGFFPGDGVLYTRRIEQMNYGGKFMGTIGNYGLGVMRAQGSAGDYYNVAQLRHTWSNKGSVQVSAVQCRAPVMRDDGTLDYSRLVDNRTTLIGADRTVYDHKDRKVSINGLFITADAKSGVGQGHRYDMGINSWGPNRTLGWSFNHQHIGNDQDYYPRLGYEPEKDVDRWTAGCSLNDNPVKGPLSYWYSGLDMSTNTHLNGDFFHNGLGLSFGCGWRNGTGIGLGFNRGNRKDYLDPIGKTQPAWYRDGGTSLSFSWGRNSLYKRGNIGLGFGRTAGGSSLSYWLGQNWPITDRLSVDASYNFSRIDHPSPSAYSAGQLIGTLAYDLDNQRTITGRLVNQTGKSNVFFAYRQRVRAGLDAYLLFGDPNALQTRRSIMLKLIRPLFQ